VKELFDRLFQKRMLIRLIGVRFSRLIQGTYQFDMFSDTQEELQLYAAMDRMRKRFGTDAITRAATLGLDKRETSLFNGIRK
jgi:DNA polymerase IV